MSIIHTIISTSQARQLSQKDNDYLRHRLADNSRLNSLLNKPVNKPLLTELLCVLDRKPIARLKAEQHRRSSKVRVYKNGKLIRIERANGKVMKYV